MINIIFKRNIGKTHPLGVISKYNSQYFSDININETEKCKKNFKEYCRTCGSTKIVDLF
jgi:hypothetical protein